MRLEFINNNSVIDGTSRKRIRTHVAIGRNTGKKLARPSRRRALGQAPKRHLVGAEGSRGADEPATEAYLQRCGRSDEETAFLELRLEAETAGPDRFCWDLELPSSLGAGSRDLVLRAYSFLSGPRYPAELSNCLDPTVEPSMFIQLFFMDEAYFHVTMAVCITALNTLGAQQEDATKAMRHISHGFRLVNARLSGSHAVSNENMAAVITMWLYERCKGRYQSGALHVAGLMQMVELRGGIGEVARTTPNLAQKIFRTDLEYSLHLGTSTRFTVEDVMMSSKPIPSSLDLRRPWAQNGGDEFHEALPSPELINQLSPPLADLFLDAVNLAQLFHDAATGQQPRLNGRDLHDTFILIGYRLLHIAPLSTPLRAGGRVENLVRVGLVAFVKTLIKGLDFSMASIPFLPGLVRTAVTPADAYSGEETVEVREALVWTLFVAAVAGPLASFDGDDTWLMPRMAETLKSMGISTWVGLSAMLSRFPWVRALHDASGEKYFNGSVSRFGEHLAAGSCIHERNSEAGSIHYENGN